MLKQQHVRIQQDSRNQPNYRRSRSYYGAGSAGYLLVSSQGNNTFVVLDRVNNDYLGSFHVAARGTVDSVEESDGADVINVPLGPAFPDGLLVVQDGDNEPRVLVEDEGEVENIATSFKFVSWASVAQAFPAPLLVDCQSFDPRGQPAEQLDRLISDVAALVQQGEILSDDGKRLQEQLALAKAALEKNRPRVTILALKAFQVQLVPLVFRHRIDGEIALSLGFAAAAVETNLGTR